MRRIDWGTFVLFVAGWAVASCVGYSLGFHTAFDGCALTLECDR